MSTALGWSDVPLAESLSAATGLLTVVENDLNALAIRESLYGDLGDHFVVVLVDDGVGSGVVVDGKVVHGASGVAGEAGHIVHQSGGRRCRCGLDGCVEAYASVPAIIAACQRRDGTGPTSLEEAAALVERGDAMAERAFRTAGEAIGQAISTLQNILNPGAILVAVPPALADERRKAPKGRGRTAAGVFHERIEHIVHERAFSTVARDCQLRIRHIPQLDERGAQGAAAVVLRGFIERPLSWHPVATVPSDARPRARDAGVETAVASEPAADTSEPNGFGSASVLIVDQEEAAEDPLAAISDALAIAMP
jgi:predicted NBD/HSP70 family sugar kinase